MVTLNDFINVSDIGVYFRIIKNYDPVVHCVEFHFDLGWEISDMADERLFENPYSQEELWDAVIYINKERCLENAAV